MGRFHAGDDSQIVQTFQGTFDMTYSHIHGSPVYWNGPSGPMIYLWGEEDVGRAFHFNGSTFDTTPATHTTVSAPDHSMPGGMLAISANGSAAGSGVLWASMPLMGDANEMTVVGILRAFDASDLSHELWNSGNDAGDAVGNFAKFSPPTVANGRVYLATFSNRLNVYGLR
jgi:hypothetical protein